MSETAVSESKQIDELCVNAVRVLSMDAVQQANSGHPGTPMALAPLCYVLWTRHLKHDPADPHWPNRDRFVLSCGHASMLLYSLLYLSGYEISSDEIRRFRQWESRTPGHPEYGMTPGVETTTGPLGQGVANAVGMAIAEAALEARFNHTGHYVLDHHTYFLCSDGDLMEGISHEACSLAGHLKLHKLIGFYDDNSITIEGDRKLADSEDVEKRFEAYGWNVLRVDDGNDLDAIDDAIDAAKAELQRPTMIIVKTHIGYGSPNKQDSADAHGAPLGEEEIKLTREQLGWDFEEPFFVPVEVISEWGKCRDRGAQYQQQWLKVYHQYKKAFPADAEELTRRCAGALPDDWDADLPSFEAEVGDVATRSVSGKVLNAIAAKMPELMGGSADLGPSNNTVIKGASSFGPDTHDGRNMHFGVREHAMGGILNGMALHGGVRPYGATFLVFSDYMRPSIRLAAMMKLPTIYVFTHDSIGLGEDGPTHQPIETLAALRAIPELVVMRPGDAEETREAWRYAIESSGGPVALILTRQKVPYLDRAKLAGADGLAKGGYVIQDADDPQVVLIATGSELHLALLARENLAEQGLRARVVSMPSIEVFTEQSAEYQREVLPEGVARLAIEAGHPQCWWRIVGDRGNVLGIDHFGASAPYEQLYEEFGLTVERIIEHCKLLMGRA